MRVLVVNAGSSSVKVSLLDDKDVLVEHMEFPLSVRGLPIGSSFSASGSTPLRMTPPARTRT